VPPAPKGFVLPPFRPGGGYHRWAEENHPTVWRPASCTQTDSACSMTVQAGENGGRSPRRRAGSPQRAVISLAPNHRASCGARRRGASQAAPRRPPPKRKRILGSTAVLGHLGTGFLVETTGPRPWPPRWAKTCATPCRPPSGDSFNRCSFIREPLNGTCRRSRDFDGGIGAGGRRTSRRSF
jgi:hypothetical protein